MKEMTRKTAIAAALLGVAVLCGASQASAGGHGARVVVPSGTYHVFYLPDQDTPRSTHDVIFQPGSTVELTIHKVNPVGYAYTIGLNSQGNSIPGCSLYAFGSPKVQTHYCNNISPSTLSKVDIGVIF